MEKLLGNLIWLNNIKDLLKTSQQCMSVISLDYICQQNTGKSNSYKSIIIPFIPL